MSLCERRDIERLVGVYVVSHEALIAMHALVWETKQLLTHIISLDIISVLNRIMRHDTIYIYNSKIIYGT